MKLLFWTISVLAVAIGGNGVQGSGQNYDSLLKVDENRDLAQEARNKALVIKFYQQVFGDRDLSNFDQFVAEDYIQHNPLLGNGRAAVKGWLSWAFPPGTPPNPRFLIERAVAEGDWVWVHVRFNLAQIPTPATDEIAVDIYRIENNLIAEHFDVIQPSPMWSENPSPMMCAMKKEYQPKCAYSRI